MSEIKPLYTQSFYIASRSKERDLWRESYNENCRCARAIEKTIIDNYDGERLKDCAESVISEFGYNRVMWVLANTVKENLLDGRYSDENKKWACQFSIPNDNARMDFCINAHPGLVDIFTNQVCRVWQDLGLFDLSHCESESEGELDYTNKVLVINPFCLKDEYKTPDDQLFLAICGFGCSPNSRGSKVYGEFLSDGEKTYYHRSDIIGILKDEYLPEWASEKLSETNEDTESEESGLTMGGI